ncbi:hypothetical protein K439DRAFT_981342 [Ramaria rubella]|nr:hypothetical protein K439DRAFT_981342 [Ramaria rubella]
MLDLLTTSPNLHVLEWKQISPYGNIHSDDSPSQHILLLSLKELRLKCWNPLPLLQRMSLPARNNMKLPRIVQVGWNEHLVELPPNIAHIILHSCYLCPSFFSDLATPIQNTSPTSAVLQIVEVLNSTFSATDLSSFARLTATPRDTLRIIQIKQPFFGSQTQVKVFEELKQEFGQIKCDEQARISTVSLGFRQ